MFYKSLRNRQQSNVKLRINWLPLTTLSLIAILSACSSDEGKVTTLDTEAEVSTGLPILLNSVANIRQDRLQPIVTLSNGSAVSITRNSSDPEKWTGQIILPTDAIYKVTVMWVERFENRDLPLIFRTFDLVVGKDGNVSKAAETGYNVDLDFDEDGISNIKEREDGTDPYVSDLETPASPDMPIPPGSVSPAPATEDDVIEPADVLSESESIAPDNDGGDQLVIVPVPDLPVPISDVPTTSPLPLMADVIVPRIAQNEAPGIDGRNVTTDGIGRLTGEWSKAVQTDMSGAILSIGNLMIDNNAELPGSTPFRRWAAMHDGDYLYLLVMVDDNGMRYRDSGIAMYDDDNLELFLDADNSKSTFYGPDDFQILFPLRATGSNPNSKIGVTSGEMRGPNSSQAAIDINFATGPGMGPPGLRRSNYEQDVYEIRLNLASVNITGDAGFGFELQINDDDDGGERDSKFGWIHPARNSENIDFTYMDPSFMGTLMLD